MNRHRQWVLATLLNAALAFAVQAAAPPQPVLSDRAKYEYAGRHPFAPDCPPLDVVYCYRVLVPAALEMLPGGSDTKWRVYRWAKITAAGTAITLLSASLTGSAAAAAAAAILAQGSYGFAFTAYDPYSADPAVFAMLAILAWCWMRGRWGLALVIGMVGIFAKETVVLMSVAMALAALFLPRHTQRTPWFAQALIVVTVLVVYRWIMQAYLGWGLNETESLIQNDLRRGGWLSLWLAGNTPAQMIFLVFASFGFAWLFAALGFRAAPNEFRYLALGSALPFLALNYVQNPERALGNLFFIVIPLAAMALARVPAVVAITAASSSALISARAATSSDWLPSAKYTLIPAAIAAGAVMWSAFRESKSART